jgi:hypothetical protein
MDERPSADRAMSGKRGEAGSVRLSQPEWAAALEDAQRHAASHRHELEDQRRERRRLEVVVSGWLRTLGGRW